MRVFWSPHIVDTYDKRIAILLSLAFLLIGSLHMVAGVCGVHHDDAIYVSTAKGPAQGQGYRLINFPGSPKQTKYPILYPAMLAIVWKLWPSFPPVPYRKLASSWKTIVQGDFDKIKSTIRKISIKDSNEKKLETRESDINLKPCIVITYLLIFALNNTGSIKSRKD